ncbi:hypothetical protein Tdes44962_MAKER08765 [Teratosphaeria destructans]|uniref:F-box domain-containing protein n=1 Tax=Teratosphaeria destructans TaxID=418781 RepID=A0A9W7W424_9PEZI|nr:hypothetical protein Tdes44962_MAKER08765 [Teratosphaeria destructans]
MVSDGQDVQMATSPCDVSEPNDGILETIMGLRGLDISQESLFDFELPPGSTEWPLSPYGPQSPHLQYAKGRKPTRDKRCSAIASPARPVKARKPKRSTSAKRKAEPRQDHGPLPPRDEPLHLLNLPGELRDIIYDILCLRKDQLYAQLRPTLQRKGRHLRKVIRRHPTEPILALVNKQLRCEVLSVFYTANSFVFRRSNEALLETYNMTNPIYLARFMTPATCFLRKVELKFEAKGMLGIPFHFSYKLQKSQAEVVTISHDLAKTYCSCLEDNAVAQTLAERNRSGVGNNLVGLAALISTQRQNKLDGVAYKDRLEGGLYKLPTARCVLCHRANLTHVGAGM